MALDPSEYLPVDGSDEPALPLGELPPDGTTLLITYPRTSPSVTPLTYKVDLDRLRVLLTPVVQAKPTVVFVTPNPAAPGTLQAGALVLLQVAATDVTGISSVTFATSGAGAIGAAVLVGSYYQLPYTIPLTATMLAVSATATNTNGVTASASTFAFVTKALAPVAAPTFDHLVDDAAGGSIQLVPAPGVPMSDYRYKLGVAGVAVQAPADGIIAVGNLEGFVYAYSVATDTQEVSPTAVSGVFTAAQQLPVVAFVAPVDGTNLINGMDVLLRVTASTPGGLAVTGVEFFVENASVGVGSLVGGVWRLSYSLPVIGNSVTITAKATNSAGAQGVTSSFVFLAQPAPVITAPDAPIIQPSVAGTNTITTTATPPAQTGGADITSYKVYRVGASSALASGLPNPSYADNTAVYPTRYSYQWSAVNSVGEGPRSAASLEVTPTAPVAPPAPGIVNPSYHGAVSSFLPTAAAVQALTAEQWAIAPRTMSAACNGTYPCFAEPASYPLRTIITDGNGYNITGDMARTTSVFSILGTAVNYNVYTHQNAQYDAAFTFSL